MTRIMRAWEAGGFRLEMDEPIGYDRGKAVIPYRLYDDQFGDDEPVFEDADFRSSPMHSEDGDETVAALLGFLSLQPGDTDREYFDSYTPEQLEWANQRAEELSLFALELSGEI